VSGPAQLDGIIVRATTGLYQVQTDEGRLACRLRGNLKKDLEFTTSGSRAKKVVQAKKKSTTDPLAIGDRVTVELLRGEAALALTGREEGTECDGEGIIIEARPRRNEVARQRRVIGAAIGEGRHVLVANIEQLVIVFAVAEPNPSPWKLDRFLVVAEAAGMDAIIVANKIDLVEVVEVDQAFDPFERLGYRVLRTSAESGIGVEALRAALRGRISSFCGPSGVGKSSLLNALYPGLSRHVSEIGEVTWKGRHGTTSAELIPIDANAHWRETGWVADTPGLRKVELWQTPPALIADCFIEFRPFLSECRFHDCTHLHEPGCAVKAAVMRGEVDQRRYEGFSILCGEAQA